MMNPTIAWIICSEYPMSVSRLTYELLKENAHRLSVRFVCL